MLHMFILDMVWYSSYCFWLLKVLLFIRTLLFISRASTVLVIAFYFFMQFYCRVAIYISAVLTVCSHHVSFMSLAVLYCCLLCDICDCVPTCNAATFDSVPHDKFRWWHNKVYLILLSWGIIIQIMYYLKTKGSCCTVPLSPTFKMYNFISDL